MFFVGYPVRALARRKIQRGMKEVATIGEDGPRGIAQDKHADRDRGGTRALGQQQLLAFSRTCTPAPARVHIDGDGKQVRGPVRTYEDVPH